MEKTRRHLRRRAQSIKGVGHASMAEKIAFVVRSMEYEGMVDKLHRRQLLCAHHQPSSLPRFGLGCCDCCHRSLFE